MSSVHPRAALALAMTMVTAMTMVAVTSALGQPYVGYVYPAGGQMGTTFRIKLGGQGVDGVHGIVVSGKGVTGKVLQHYWPLGTEGTRFLHGQLDWCKSRVPKDKWDKLTQATSGSNSEMAMMAQEMEMSGSMNSPGGKSSGAAIDADKLGIDPAIVSLVRRIRARMAEYVLYAANPSITNLVFAEITIAADAPPGKREIRLVCQRGTSNPMPFFVGQVPEVSRPPMLTSEKQVLGKEELALRRRGANVERRVTIPCTINGQIASAEVHHYRFKARAGQQLVIASSARELVPFIADAVPGWFQAVLTLYDARGKEVAYNDRFSFNPDPLILYKVPKDGEYLLTINDSIYRGREDFVYRVTINETPLVTSIFPLGAQFGASPPIAMKGWNLDGATLSPPLEDSETGYHILMATKGRWESNRVLFAPDTLPECLETEPNNDQEHAQKTPFPIIINGRIDRPDDWDVFQFTGHAGETIVAEVIARRLNSPLDSVLILSDAHGKLLAINDDYDDPEAGTKTHYADSYITMKLPADGTYYLRLGDSTRSGGEDYAYRLRISKPRPDFELRVAPSSVRLRGGGSDTLTVYVYRKDGFAETINVYVKNPPPGISGQSATISGNDPVAKLTVSAGFDAKPGLYDLTVYGSARIVSPGKPVEEIIHEAVPSDDRMQAFLWRHLVPAKNLKAYVVDHKAEEQKAGRKRQEASATRPAAAKPGGAKPKFTKEQVAGDLRLLHRLHDEGLLTEEYFQAKLVEYTAE